MIASIHQCRLVPVLSTSPNTLTRSTTVLADKVEYEQARPAIHSIQMAVSFPFSVVGEEFRLAQGPGLVMGIDLIALIRLETVEAKP
jgi:hypothetical protein